MQTTYAYERLTASLADAPIIAKGDYDYFVHPLSDGIPRVEPAVLQEATEGIVRHLGADLDRIDLFVTAEAMGLPLAAAVSLATGKPFVTVRKRAYGLAGERVLEQRTGYSHTKLYLNGIRPGDRVAILDDVISTGGTLRALADGLRDAGAELVRVAAVFTKEPGLEALARAVDAPVSALLSCQVVRDGAARHVEIVGTDCTSDRS